MSSTERCGKCGTELPLGTETCPVCGALLAAYRNPLETPQHPAPVIESITPPVPPPAPLEGPPRVDETAPPAVEQPAGPADDAERLRAARERLVRLLAEPERELIHVIEARDVQPAGPEPVPITIAAPRTAHSPARPRRVPAQLIPAPPAPLPPRRPGYMVKGNVIAPITWGIVLLLVGCATIGLGGEEARSDGLTVFVAVLCWLIAVICFVVAIFITLVRRERDRD